MTIVQDAGGSDLEAALGIAAPAQVASTAPPTATSSGAPTLGSSPGQAVTLTASGGLPTTLANSVLQLVSSGQHRIAMGSGSLTFSATSSADGVVTHGLGVVPVVVLACANLDSLNFWYATAYGSTKTQFTVRGISTAGAATASPSFWWLAIS